MRTLELKKQCYWAEQSEHASKTVRCTGVVLFFSNLSTILLLSKCLTLTAHIPEVCSLSTSEKSKKEKREQCGGEQRERLKLHLPSVAIGNVRSMANKMDELSGWARTQRDYLGKAGFYVSHLHA